MLLASLAAAAATAAILELVLTLHWRRHWADRGYHTDALTTLPTRITRLTAAACGVTAGLWYGPWQAAAAAAALLWLAAVAWMTDLTDHRIPSEPCWTVLIINTGFGLWAYAAAATLSAVVALITTAVIVTLVVLVTRGGLGSGDARLLLALSTVAWWSGYTPVLSGLLFAAVIQAIARFTVYRRRTTQRGYPFAPALVLGYTAAVIMFGAPGVYCAEWAYTIAC